MLFYLIVSLLCVNAALANWPPCWCVHSTDGHYLRFSPDLNRPTNCGSSDCCGYSQSLSNLGGRCFRNAGDSHWCTWKEAQFGNWARLVSINYHGSTAWINAAAVSAGYNC